MVWSYCPSWLFFCTAHGDKAFRSTKMAMRRTGELWMKSSWPEWHKALHFMILRNFWRVCKLHLIPNKSIVYSSTHQSCSHLLWWWPRGGFGLKHWENVQYIYHHISISRMPVQGTRMDWIWTNSKTNNKKPACISSWPWLLISGVSLFKDTGD